jgi:hypothetical protein
VQVSTGTVSTMMSTLMSIDDEYSDNKLSDD